MTRLEKCELAKEKGFTYNPETGELFRINGNQIKTKNKKGYICFNLTKNNKKYKLYGHHFAWYMTYNNLDFKLIDHINRIEYDNRISNLRSVTNAQNQWNKQSKGYWFEKDKNKWRSRIYVNNNAINLGYFNTEEDAKLSYLEAKEKYHII